VVRARVRVKTGRMPASTAHSLFIDDSSHGSKVRIARLLVALLIDLPLVVVVVVVVMMMMMMRRRRRRGG
jgi:hypothetical protein